MESTCSQSDGVAAYAPSEKKADVVIAELCAADLKKGFLEALASLAEADMTYEEALKVFQARLRAGNRTYVAKINDLVVGTATLLVERKFIHHGGLVGHIEDVSVHKDFQRRGIGTAIVRHITEEARKMGCYKVILNCFESLAPFYKRIGYRNHDVGLRIDWK
jgi:glucosamine-phosphate N-acetyltransferase